MKYIGIRGHRGAGKSTTAFLLANTIEFLLKKTPEDTYKESFEDWCQTIKEYPDIVYDVNCKHVIIEGFGDTPKMLLSMLTGIDLNDMNKSYNKDHILINLRNFSNILVDDIKEYNIKTAAEVYEIRNNSQNPESPLPITEDTWITLREMILYFGIYVMQNFFGLNVWVKSLVANNRYFSCLFPDDCDDSQYKIFMDIKARSEVSYIKDHKGIIIKVSRPTNKKQGGMNLLVGNSVYDYEINIDRLEDSWEQFIKISKQIIQQDESL